MRCVGRDEVARSTGKAHTVLRREGWAGSILWIMEKPGENPSAQIQRVKVGCGVQGCLTVAVVVFVMLMVAMLAIALLRSWPTPVVGP